MRHLILGLAILTSPALIATGCKRTDRSEVAKEAAEEQREHQEQVAKIEREKTEDLREENKEHREEMGELQRDAFLATANNELDRLDRNIEELKDRADKLSGQARKDIDAQIETLEDKYDAVKNDIDKAKDKTDAEFSELRSNFEAGLRDLQKSYDELAAKVG